MYIEITSRSHPAYLLNHPTRSMTPEDTRKWAENHLPKMGELEFLRTTDAILIRTAQLLVAQGKITGQVTIYESGKEITLDENGQLSEAFESGFFDVSTNLMMDLFKYQR